MDTKLSCYVWGIVGVIFGMLALLFPEQLQDSFYWFFLVLTGVVILVFLFLAITSKSEESLFWFGLSAGLLLLAVISSLVPGIVEIVFLLNSTSCNTPEIYSADVSTSRYCNPWQLCIGVWPVFHHYRVLPERGTGTGLTGSTSGEDMPDKKTLMRDDAITPFQGFIPQSW
jgi:hypothetical protein